LTASRFSVLVPVKDGERYLDALLAAVAAERPGETIVIDSGSRDRSVVIARRAGARVIEIASEEFGHGRTRNLAAEQASGDLICFLTQDAVPLPGWLDAYREAFELDTRVGMAYGPHVPRPETSPMIARELEEFFGGFSLGGAAAVQALGDDPFLSNVNACYSRECWDEVRFPDVAYAEDQAFARAALQRGWKKVYHPRAAVMHAHDFGRVEFMRRYFDEYRGLREATGHVEPLGFSGVGRSVREDLRWMRARGWTPERRLRAGASSLAHHSGRRVFSALGSRAERLPGTLERALSLEGRAGPPGNSKPAGNQPTPYTEMLRLAREGPEPLLDSPAGLADRERIHVAVIVPPFGRGSGGHAAIFTLVRELERMGHTCSLWVHDPVGVLARTGDAVLRRRVLEEFTPVRAPVMKGFHAWHGADVVVATGWETVYAALMLPGCHARAYLVNDHEPEFFPSSAEAIWAERTYSLGLYPISGSRWLRDLIARRYGADGSWYRFGVDHAVYSPQPVARRRDTVIFYGRAATPRRAVPLGVLALEELRRRRPQARIVAFGDESRLQTSLPHEDLGVVEPGTLARAYSEATAGLCLSLTNLSLIPQEMMACGLPCVDVAGGSTEAELGSDGPVLLAEPDPIAIADALEALLTDEALWKRKSDAGVAAVADVTWSGAAKQVERGLRAALRAREAVA
jgi:GT2 family glycosyltransferase/glycosyltransferase involved in cell wall biosynthesis